MMADGADFHNSDFWETEGRGASTDLRARLGGTDGCSGSERRLPNSSVHVPRGQTEKEIGFHCSPHPTRADVLGPPAAYRWRVSRRWLPSHVPAVSHLNGWSPAWRRTRLTCSQAAGTRLRNRTSWPVETSNCVAAGPICCSCHASRSSTAARTVGKSGLSSETRSPLPVRYGATAAANARGSPGGSRCSMANARRSLLWATRRFSAWLRRSDALARTPVGRCSIVTAVSTLLRCCPPGPFTRPVVMRQSPRSFSHSRAAGCCHGGAGGTGVLDGSGGSVMARTRTARCCRYPVPIETRWPAATIPRHRDTWRRRCRSRFAACRC